MTLNRIAGSSLFGIAAVIVVAFGGVKFFETAIAPRLGMGK